MGPTQLEWSLNSTAGRTGWLYFYQPETTNAVWEFAPCSHSRLADITPAELKCQFYGVEHPVGREVFGTNWDARAIRVREGQIVLARNTESPGVVYVLKIEQEGTGKIFGAVKVRFLAVRTNKPPNAALEPL